MLGAAECDAEGCGVALVWHGELVNGLDRSGLVRGGNARCRSGMVWKAWVGHGPVV